AGLSIQDPRERPLDRQAQADTAHRRFAHPDSDFLTLLNIWEALHGEFEVMTQGRLRRFCHEHFLSYTRLREWRDIHDQLLEVLEERDDFKLTSVRDGVVAGGADSGPASPRPATARAQKSKSQTPNPKSKTRNAELGFGTPAYRAIHRSILAGLLGNIAVRDEPTGLYRAAHAAGQQSKVTLFPGSVLHAKPEKPGKASPAKTLEAGGSPVKRTARWIMAAEIVETTRLFARTVARLDPAWALDLGAHLLRVSHTDPFWNAEAGRVLVRRRARLYGLELESRAVGYGKIDPVRATEIFIREALVNDTITWPFDFLVHNRKVRDKVEIILTRTRSSGYLNLDEAMYRFYAARLLPEGRDGPPAFAEVSAGRPDRPSKNSARPAVAPYQGISSVPELVDLVRERRRTEPAFLQLEPEDLRGAEAATHDAAAFPDTLPLENRVLPIDYAYRPGQEEDGVTITVAARDAAALTPAALDWAVPGHLEEKVLHLLKALPTSQRRTLIPLAETAKAAARAVAQHGHPSAGRQNLAETLAGHLREAHRLAVDLRGWAEKPLPDHLRVRVQVVDEAGRPLAASRDLAELHQLLEKHQRELSVEAARDPAGRQSAEWRDARAKWEQGAQTAWTFGEIPGRIHVCDQAGVPVYAYPALVPVTAGVALRLMQSPEEAQAAQQRGLFHLFELQLRHELAWLQRDLRDLRAVGVLAAAFTPAGTLPEQAMESLRRWACGRRVAPLTAEAFTRELERIRTDLRGVVPRLTDRLREIFTLRQELLTHPQPYSGLAEDLAALLPPDFLAATPFARLDHLSRYLKAMKLRADRWKQNPERDAGRARQLAPYVQAVAAWPRAAVGAAAAEHFRWLVEEFRVSLFAQELGTAEPVSPMKLDRELEALRHAGAPADAATRGGNKPAPVATPAAGGPLKSLGA
ncbi:MAG: DUF3418 domain-containing protein, partial [Opitutaceae bacterium]